MIKFRVGEREYGLRRRTSGSLRKVEMRQVVSAQLPEGDPRREEFAQKMHERDIALQEKVADEVRRFDPVTDEVEDFNFAPVGEVLRHATVDEMADMFNYSEAQRAIIDAIFYKQVTEPFGKLIKDKSEKHQVSDARAFHVGYVAGQIERCFPSMKNSSKEPLVLRMERARLQYITDITLQMVRGNSDELLSAKLEFLRNSLEQLFPQDQDGVEAAMALVTRDSWLLDDFNEEDELALDMNQAGLLATRAVVEFAQQMYFDKSLPEVLQALENLIHLPDRELQDIALMKGKKTRENIVDAQIILFAVRSANYAWIFSKIPQGFAEQKQVVNALPAEMQADDKRAKLSEWQAKKPAKGAGRYTHSETQNKYFTTFDNMSDDKGWPAVLLDMDQIRTGIRILRRQYNAKRSEE